jgi:hypothetical protein
MFSGLASDWVLAGKRPRAKSDRAVAIWRSAFLLLAEDAPALPWTAAKMQLRFGELRSLP